MKTKDEAQPTYEMIAARAYQRYLERGRQDGHDMEDWIAAETELRAATRGSTEPPSTTTRVARSRNVRDAESRS